MLKFNWFKGGFSIQNKKKIHEKIYSNLRRTIFGIRLLPTNFELFIWSRKFDWTETMNPLFLFHAKFYRGKFVSSDNIGIAVKLAIGYKSLVDYEKVLEDCE